MSELINKFELLIDEYNETAKVLRLIVVLTDIVDEIEPPSYTPWFILDPLLEGYQQFLKYIYEQLGAQMAYEQGSKIIDYEETEITLESDYALDFIEPKGMVPYGWEALTKRFMYTRFVLHYRSRTASPTYDDLPAGYDDLEHFAFWGTPFVHGAPGLGLLSPIDAGIFMSYPIWSGSQWYEEYRLRKEYVSLIEPEGTWPNYMENPVDAAFVQHPTDLDWYWNKGINDSILDSWNWIETQVGYGRSLYQRLFWYINQAGQWAWQTGYFWADNPPGWPPDSPYWNIYHPGWAPTGKPDVFVPEGDAPVRRPGIPLIIKGLLFLTVLGWKSVAAIRTYEFLIVNNEQLLLNGEELEVKK